MNPVHAPSHFFKIHFNITLQLCLGLPSELFPSGFPTKNLHALPFSCCPAQQSTSRPATLPCARNTWFPLDLRLGDNLSHYVSFADGNNLFSCLFYEKAGMPDQCWSQQKKSKQENAI